MNILNKCIALCIAFLLSGCSGCMGEHDGSDDYYKEIGDDGSTCSDNFKTVAIGTQTWMAENLNCKVINSRCSDDDCAKYGRLYDWKTAMDVCPTGWHLPSQEEWNTLLNYVEYNSGCSKCAASKLKATSGWDSDGNGTDDYGFSALPGGYNSDVVGSKGYWWSASERIGSDNNYAYGLDMYYDAESTNWGSYGKSNSFSVRCLQNSP